MVDKGVANGKKGKEFKRDLRILNFCKLLDAVKG